MYGVRLSGRAQSESALLDDKTAVFDIEQTGCFGDGAGLFGHDAQLQPEGGSTRIDRLAGDIGCLPRGPEHVYQADLLGDVGDLPIDRLAKDLGGVWIDRDDAPAVLLHVGGYTVSRLGRGGAGAHHGDGVVQGQDVLDDSVGISHSPKIRPAPSVRVNLPRHGSAKDQTGLVATEEQRWNNNIHYHPVILATIPPGSRRALDVGCGDGYLTRQLHHHGVPEVIGIDRHEPSIVAARNHPDSEGITYLVGDVLSYPFEREGFDLVAAVASLHHMDTMTALARLRELVAPGGVLAVVGLARSDLPTDIPKDLAGMIISRIYKRSKPFHGQTSPIVWPPPDRYATTRRVAREMLPGVRWQRHLLFRYSLVWTKPR